MIKIVLLGATGWIGNAIAKEALSRGHQLTAIVRDPLRVNFSHQRLQILVGDIYSQNDIAGMISGHDVLAAAIRSPKTPRNFFLPLAAASLVMSLRNAGMQRLLWVGSAATLDISSNEKLIDSISLSSPNSYEALEQYATLKLLQMYCNDISWNYISPPIVLTSGTRTGFYRIGGSQLLKNGEGDSTISVTDYATAFVDEIESSSYVRKQIHFTY